MHPAATRTLTNRLELHKALRLFHGDGPERSADTDIDWPRVRDLARSPIREALAQERVPAYVFEETGRQHLIPAWLWDGSELWAQAYESGLVKVPLEGRAVPGYLVVDADAFAALVEIGDPPAATQAAPSRPAYMPPYLAYMLELLERFDLTPDYKYNKEIMKHVIENDDVVREYGINMSGSKAGMMATFLGNPKFEDGGNTAATPKDRDPDPRKPFNGVSYPKARRRA